MWSQRICPPGPASLQIRLMMVALTLRFFIEFFFFLKKYKISSTSFWLKPEIGVGELVELGPTLWNIHAPLLHQRMQPRQHKQGLNNTDRSSLEKI